MCTISNFVEVVNFLLGNELFLCFSIAHSLHITLLGYTILGKSITANVVLTFSMLSKLIWQNLLCLNQLSSTLTTKHVIWVGFNWNTLPLVLVPIPINVSFFSWIIQVFSVNCNWYPLSTSCPTLKRLCFRPSTN